MKNYRRENKQMDVFTETDRSDINVNTFNLNDMKRPTNFRLDDISLKTISILSGVLKKSKTEVVVEALAHYKGEIADRTNPMLRLAGSITDHEADEMIKIIKESKKSKDYTKYRL